MSPLSLETIWGILLDVIPIKKEKDTTVEHMLTMHIVGD